MILAVAFPDARNISVDRLSYIKERLEKDDARVATWDIDPNNLVLGIELSDERTLVRLFAKQGVSAARSKELVTREQPVTRSEIFLTGKRLAADNMDNLVGSHAMGVENY